MFFTMIPHPENNFESLKFNRVRIMSELCHSDLPNQDFETKFAAVNRMILFNYDRQIQGRQMEPHNRCS